MPLQIRRGTTAERLTITPLPGELIYDTTTGGIFVGDGIVAGGQVTTGVSIEDARDAAASLFTTGSHTGIAFVYSDDNNRIDANVVGPVPWSIISEAPTNVSEFVNDSGYLASLPASPTFTNVSTSGLFVNNLVDRSIDIARLRGTFDIPQSVVVGDRLGGLRFDGYSSSFITGAEIRATVSSTTNIGTGMPTALEFILNDRVNSPKTLFTMSGERELIECRNSIFSVNFDGDLNNPVRPQIGMTQHHEVADGNNFSFIRGRGTSTAPTTIASGDDIVDITFLGYNGTSYANAASISVICSGTPVSTGIPGRMIFRTNSGTASGDRLTIQPTGEVVASVALLNNGSGGIGYSTGAGGAGTQLTNKSTTVVLNKVTGEITLHNESLAAGTTVTFTLTNSTIAANDHIIVTHVSAGSLGAYNLTAIAGTGSASITLRNLTGGDLSEAIVIKYSVIKSTVS